MGQVTTHRRTVGFPAGMVLVALTAAMLFPLAAAPVASAQPASTTNVTVPQYGFSFSLLPRWAQVPLDAKDIAALVSAETKANPGLGNVLDRQALQAAEQGVKVFAIGPITRGPLPRPGDRSGPRSGGPHRLGFRRGLDGRDKNAPS